MTYNIIIWTEEELYSHLRENKSFFSRRSQAIRVTGEGSCTYCSLLLKEDMFSHKMSIEPLSVLVIILKVMFYFRFVTQIVLIFFYLSESPHCISPSPWRITAYWPALQLFLYKIQIFILKPFFLLLHFNFFFIATAYKCYNRACKSQGGKQTQNNRGKFLKPEKLGK